MKIIFLDFDGVLIPTFFSSYMEKMNFLSNDGVAVGDRYGKYFAPDCLENLKILVQETGANIIFSTKWKDLGFDKLKEMWDYRCNYNLGEVIGCTPCLQISSSNRGDEIGLWLSMNDCDTYVILDDMGECNFKQDQLSHLVECDEKLGFTKKRIRESDKNFEIIYTSSDSINFFN